MWRYNNTGEAISFLHTKNIRVHFPITKLVTDALHGPLYRYQLITKWMEIVNDYCYDGISFDVELPMYANSTKDSYALLVEETRHALDKIDENLEISMAVPFTPEPLGCISGRCKRWRRMSKVVNQVFIMGYDSQDNILVATPSSPLDKIKDGVQAYLDLGIPASKIVLGIHWMAFVFPCIFTANNSNRIPPCFVNFTGRKLEDITATIDICAKFSLDGIHYHEPSHTMFCTTINEPSRRSNPDFVNGEFKYKLTSQRKGRQQRWFDSPATLNEKFQMVRRLGVNGFGMWYMDALHYPINEYPISLAYWESISEAAKEPLAENEVGV